MDSKCLVLVGNEGCSLKLSISKIDEIIPYVKDFVKYARGCSVKKDGKIIYHDFRHLSQLTILGNHSDIEHIDKNIIVTDWDVFENVF